jgi:hypothetical protein
MLFLMALGKMALSLSAEDIRFQGEAGFIRIAS